jgi:hypothetical protein
MTGSFAAMLNPAPGSLVERWRRKHAANPDIFECSVRVLQGRVEHEGRRWRRRRSAVDPLSLDGAIALNHGEQSRLRLIIEPDPFADRLVRRRGTGDVVFCAIERETNALVQVSVRGGELLRFGFVPR